VRLVPGVNVGLAHASDHFLLFTVVAYSLAMLAFAGDLAYGRRQRAIRSAAASTDAADRAPQLVGAAVGDAAADGTAASGTAASGTAATDTAATDTAAGDGAAVSAAAVSAAAGDGAQNGQVTAGGGTTAAHQPAGPWVRAALALTAVGLAAHVVGIVTRGLAANRIPWGNMYEFVTAITCGAIIVFLLLVARYRAYFLGLFVMVPVVLGLGLCATVLYTADGPLMPALHSYWIAIHVTAAIIASGTFTVAATANVAYLLADRYQRRLQAGLATGETGIMRHFPKAAVLDRLSYRTAVFGFPIWTFAIMAGAIWADQAWGRYWGWDPKETWSFITWVVYAGFLHARATAGWRGRRAAYIQLVGFACLMFNLVGVNVWITGLHSYAGIN
jgi:cytochrome c-type biogenesis protein CcsB